MCFIITDGRLSRNGTIALFGLIESTIQVAYNSFKIRSKKSITFSDFDNLCRKDKLSG